MRKKLYLALISSFILFFVCACGGKVENAQKSSSSKTEIIHEIDKKDEKTSSDTTIESGEPKEEVYLLANNKVKKDGHYELTYKKNGISRVVKPPNTSGYYRYYEAEKSDHKYIYVVVTYKNLDDSMISVDRAGQLSVTYAGKYDYSAFSVIVDGDGDFASSSSETIDPLSSKQIYYLVDVPEEVANGKEPIIATLTVGIDEYKIKIR